MVNILGAAFGALLGVPLIYFWGERAVAPSIVVAALCSIFASWWMVRRIKFDRFSSRWADLWTKAGALAKLGVVLLSTTLMATGVAYLIRSLVSRHLGVDAAGQYQAAWSMAGQYVNFILQAMAVDFYPRLTAVEKQRDVCNRLVNEQAEVGILLAGPGILATLTFAPFVIQLLFSDKFGPAMELLRWNCLGMLFRVAAWPMGYLMLARNERKLYFSTAFLVHAANLALVWLLVPKWGLLATGVAVFASGVLDFALMLAVAVRINGFRFSGVNAKLGLLFAPLAAALFVGWSLPSTRNRAGLRRSGDSSLRRRLLPDAHRLRLLAASPSGAAQNPLVPAPGSSIPTGRSRSSGHRQELTPSAST